MPNHDLHLHRHLQKKKKLTLFDKVVFVASFAYPLSGLPQAISVFNGNTVGVSFISWASFLVFSGLFLTYGLKHKVVPMIITNSIWLLVDGSVVVGLLLAHS